jgi:nicotinamide-nucleotide amidase
MIEAEQVFELLLKHNMKLVTAESCTGGMVAAAITDIAGSSQVFERGFVTYSNESKTELLGVTPWMLQTYGAVSPEVAKAMAEGALKNSKADLAVSITGIAGPGGGTTDKPVGLVYLSLLSSSGDFFQTKLNCVPNLPRDRIRWNATRAALHLILDSPITPLDKASDRALRRPA